MNSHLTIKSVISNKASVMYPSGPSELIALFIGDLIPCKLSQVGVYYRTHVHNTPVFGIEVYYTAYSSFMKILCLYTLVSKLICSSDEDLHQRIQIL